MTFKIDGGREYGVGERITATIPGLLTNSQVVIESIVNGFVANGKVYRDSKVLNTNRGKIIPVNREASKPKKEDGTWNVRFAPKILR